ncbi:hypothetical protein FHR24_000799 [Wenyingzhuangia heitensis]|uniref:Deoxyribose-phosphate aldolase n=1 Tax=Wenyingzhuangia heitensis TaxID=1487859 RepID=A0ABX0U8U8_9FLAO|nr:DUF6503 family protein [Wenyingzhuangia heitensis]NIJ44360.1 hypothetical protein [Wenyingzhuangia heitensis]
MKFIKTLSITCLFITIIACQPKKQPQITNTPKNIKKGEEIVNKAIAAHGGDLYKTASYSFDFRGKEYSFTHKGDEFKYTLKNKEILDVLENGNFSRYQQGQLIELSPKKRNSYSAALNSVLYFSLLPYKLNDAAVHKTYIDTITIKNKKYHTVKVTFDENGGGEDHQDIFYYWINNQTNTVEYIAYKYEVNGGGIRFRSAYNTRNVDGILFQDYINYKAPFETKMTELPSLYETEQLKEVSRINITNITAIR